MKSIRLCLSRFARDARGANAVEYALVMALVACAIIVGAGNLGTAINAIFQSTATQVSGVTVPAF